MDGIPQYGRLFGRLQPFVLPSVWLFQAVWTVFWAAIAVHFAAIIAVLGRLGGILSGCSRSFCRP
jgi:tryptophan-rich sensory protein